MVYRFTKPRRLLDDPARAQLIKTTVALLGAIAGIQIPVFLLSNDPRAPWALATCIYFVLKSIAVIFFVNRGYTVPAGLFYTASVVIIDMIVSPASSLVARPLGGQLILPIIILGLVLGFDAAVLFAAFVIVFLITLPLYSDAAWSFWVAPNIAIIVVVVLLLQRMANLMTQLQQSNQREQQVRRVMRYFQHELSSYVTALKGLVPLLPASNLSEKSVVTFNILGRTVEHINELLQELLILGREGDLPPQQRQKVVVRDVLEQVQQATRTTLQQRDLPITVAAPPDLVVLGNPLYLTVAVRAAVRNALDALNQRTVQRAPQVRLEAAQVGASVIISIEDSGPGFPPEIIAAFEQARARKEPLTPGWSSKTEGYGLGLALIDYIARLHGGKIDLGNLPGRAGAWVNIEVPADVVADVGEPEALAYGAT